MPKRRDEATWFSTPAGLRDWLEANHATETELWVGLRKKHVPGGVTWAEAVDEVLCYGWIDGVTHRVDDDGYTSRITPRTPRSIWSAVNLKRIEELIALDLVRPSGLKAYRERDLSRAGLYAFEQESVAFDQDQAATFAANEAAWSFFQTQPPGYRRLATWWVISARRPETRTRRLAQLIDDSANGRRLKQYARS